MNKTKLVRSLKIAAPFLMLAIALMPEMAWASAAPWETGANKVLSILSGNLAKICATIAIVFLGYSAFMGRIEPVKAITIASGIIIIFSAPAIVNLLAGG